MQFITAFDTNILWWINAHLTSPFMDKLMPAITHLGDVGAIWIAITVILLLRKSTRKWGVTMLFSLFLCVLVGNLLLKPLVARPRPCHIHQLQLLIPMPTDLSFPSGHTMTSFASAAVLFHYHKTYGKAALILAALIAFSRLYLLVHYPTDVAAGLVLGLVAAIIACKLTDYFYTRYKRSNLSN